tara:strand:+ start:2008 stop:2892 length:885 start_codon:yes stop_codon:yes gene_type:complete
MCKLTKAIEVAEKQMPHGYLCDVQGTSIGYMGNYIRLERVVGKKFLVTIKSSVQKDTEVAFQQSERYIYSQKHTLEDFAGQLAAYAVEQKMADFVESLKNIEPAESFNFESVVLEESAIKFWLLAFNHMLSGEEGTQALTRKVLKLKECLSPNYEIRVYNKYTLVKSKGVNNKVLACQIIPQDDEVKLQFAFLEGSSFKDDTKVFETQMLTQLTLLQSIAQYLTLKDAPSHIEMQTLAFIPKKHDVYDVFSVIPSMFPGQSYDVSEDFAFMLFEAVQKYWNEIVAKPKKLEAAA